MSKRMKLGSNIIYNNDKFNFNLKRLRRLNKINDVNLTNGRCIVYWMFRDQRSIDNWSLIYSYRIAQQNNIPLLVYFPLIYPYEGYNLRHYRFMLQAINELFEDFNKINVQLVINKSFNKDFIDDFKRFINISKASLIVVDHLPMIQYYKWLHSITNYASQMTIPVIQIDAHNIVPTWIASDKVEYAARTIRAKLMNQLGEFLTDYPLLTEPLIKCNFLNELSMKDFILKWSNQEYEFLLDYFKSVIENNNGSSVVKDQIIEWASGGKKRGLEILDNFLTNGVKKYADSRNDPTMSLLTDDPNITSKSVVSNLSPWLHFGHISAQTIINQVSKLKQKFPESVSSFVEELFVRKELSDNFCHHTLDMTSNEEIFDLNKTYTNYVDVNEELWLKSIASWSLSTLELHKIDKRTYNYSLDQLIEANTHDGLWNASQIQMIRYGKMHGFLRMYWAKKILEWTPNAHTAFNYSLYLNDRFNLDGSDPNGIVGCLWSIYGLHDQGWKERPIFGKIRYMNYQGCTRKFSVEKFIAQYKNTK